MLRSRMSIRALALTPSSRFSAYIFHGSGSRKKTIKNVYFVYIYIRRAHPPHLGRRREEQSCREGYPPAHKLRDR